MADMRVDLFGVQCNTDVPDGNGVLWNVGGVGGWGSPDVISIRQRPTGRFGSVVLDEALGERVITVPGWVDAPSASAAWAAFEQLSVMPGVGASGTVTVHQVNGARSALVRQAEQPRTPDDIIGNSFEFLLTLVALQPYKTGASHTVTLGPGASATLVNDGTATAYLTATVSAFGRVELRQDSSGQVLRSKGASVATGTVFDSGARQVRSGGGVVLAGVVDNPSEWLSIPRLSSTPVTNLGTATVDVTFYDSYA